jgi:hypothetical protein
MEPDGKYEVIGADTGPLTMGIEHSFSPRYFRRRAEAYRTRADNADDGETRASLLRMAQRYDELARRAEKVRTLEDLQG